MNVFARGLRSSCPVAALAATTVGREQLVEERDRRVDPRLAPALLVDEVVEDTQRDQRNNACKYLVSILRKICAKHN